MARDRTPDDRWQLTYTDPPTRLQPLGGTGQGFLTLMSEYHRALIDVVVGVMPADVAEASWNLITEWLDPEWESDIQLEILDARCLPSDLEAWLAAHDIEVIGAAGRTGASRPNPTHRMAIELLVFCEARYDLLADDAAGSLLSCMLRTVIDSAHLPTAFRAFCGDTAWSTLEPQ